MNLDVHQLDQFVLWGSAVTLLAILAVRLTSRAGLPSLLIYLLIGVALGEEGLGISFEDAQVAHALGLRRADRHPGRGRSDHAAGRTSGRRCGSARRSRPWASRCRSGVMTLAGHYLLGLAWELAILLGAVTSPTDAAAVFSVLRVVRCPNGIQGALEAESGLNDAPTVVLVTLVSTGAFADHGLLGASALIVFELVAGVAFGLAVGFGGAWLMRRAALPASGLYPLAVLTLCFLAYGGAAAVHASGFAAVYVAALVLGNQELPHRAATRSFAEGVAVARPDRAVRDARPAAVAGADHPRPTSATAIVAGLVLTLVARPLSVLVSSVVRPDALRELSFISWAGLRGAVPIVLATIPLSEGVDGSEQLFDIVFVLVVVYTLLTGPTLPAVAKVLKVARRSEPRGLDIEAAPLERVAADLLQITISPVSKMHGVEVGELRLPPGRRCRWWSARGRRWCPSGARSSSTATTCSWSPPAGCGRPTEERLRQVSAHGRLAQWLGRRPRR